MTDRVYATKRQILVGNLVAVSDSLRRAQDELRRCEKEHAELVAQIEAEDRSPTPATLIRPVCDNCYSEPCVCGQHKNPMET